MKSENLKVILCGVLLLLISIMELRSIKGYYEEIINFTGLSYNDFEKELKEENIRALENQDEYQKMITESKDENLNEAKKESSVHTMKLHARSALLMDGSNNRILYEKNGYQEMPMASTTKIMTCIVTLENSDLSDVVTVSAYASKMPDVQLNIKPGEKYYLKDLLYSLMLESHNDVAVAIAEHVGGSVEGFATMMNDKARELGCNNTNFVTPNGLDAEGHHTTAKDLAMIASYAIKNDKFIAITNTPSHVFQEINSGRKFSVSNKNKFLYMMEGAIGVKTGFTGGAGYCFVGAVKRQDRTLISVVLGSGWPPSRNLKWMDTKELMNYGIKNYKKRQIFEDKKFDPVFVKDGQQKYEKLDIEGNISLLLRDDEAVRIEYDIPKMLQAPVKSNRVIGKASYYINDMLYTEIPIYTTTDIAKIDYPFCLRKLIKLWSFQY